MDSERLCETVAKELAHVHLETQFCFLASLEGPSTFLHLTLKDSALRYLCKASPLNADLSKALSVLQAIRQRSPLSCIEITHCFSAEQILFSIMPKGEESLKDFLLRGERLSDDRAIDLLF